MWLTWTRKGFLMGTVTIDEDDLEGLLGELKFLRAQRDDLQRDNTLQVERRRKAEQRIKEPLLPESFFQTVVKWHLATGNPVRPCPDWLDGAVGNDDSLRLGMELIREEFRELQEAWAKCDPVETADAIGDLVWVLCGFSARLGYDLDAVWAEIKLANYKKVGGPRRDDGKLMKPPGWEPPDIQGALRNSMPLAGFM